MMNMPPSPVAGKGSGPRSPYLIKAIAVHNPPSKQELHVMM